MLDCPSELCTHCGACESVCPVNIIKLDKDAFIPQIKRPDLCTNCNLCNRVCPGYQVDFKQLTREYGIDSAPFHNPYLGYYRRIYLARSSKPRLVKQASAGGLVTGLLQYAFKKNLIDGALVVRMSRSNPIQAEGYIARSAKQLIGSPQSKYQIVPLLRLIKDCHSLSKLAFVGLGCQVEALRKWCIINPDFKKRIRYILGLYCSLGNNSIQGTQFMVKGLGIKRVKSLSFRAGHYPGGLSVSSGKTKAFLRKDEYKWFSLLFTENRCMQCIDFTNELADISVGDSFSLSGSDKKGKSVVILRTENGEHFFKSALADGDFKVKGISADFCIQSQRYQFSLSKLSIPKRNECDRAKGRTVPLFKSRSVNFRRSTLREHAEAFLTFFIFKWRKLFIIIFERLPFSFFKLISRFSKRS